MPLKHSSRWAPVLAFLVGAFVPALQCNTARAQTIEAVQPFKIDLGAVGKYYDTLYRDRVTGELTDSLRVFDWEHVPFGELRYRVKTFLPTDVAQTHQVVDYDVVPGYRTRFSVPNVAFFETTEQEVGEITVEEPRDFSIPGLEVDLVSMKDLVGRIEKQSREQVWVASAYSSVTSRIAQSTSTASGGIQFNIPLPMPKSLESIFGPGEKTSITIKGREEITLAGETSVVDPFIGIEGREKQSLFPSLDMQQKLDVSLTGTIGDKVSIQLDHSSEAIGDDANRVRLAYTGYEDEVIQLIELGNTSLSLPGSQLVSFSASAQGLFGAKMLAKMGSTDLTVIASKQEGEVSNSTFSPTGGALGQAETRTIKDIEYVKNKYFYFDNPRIFIGPDDSKTIEVYRTVTQTDLQLNPNINRLPGWAVADSLGTGVALQAAAAAIQAGGSPVGALQQDFLLLQKDVDYFYILDSVTQDVIGLELAEAIQDQALKSLAVLYTNAQQVAIGGTYASYGLPPDPEKGNMLILEMLKAPEPRPAPSFFPGTWELMIRNIYNLGLTNIDGNTVEVVIEDVFNPRLNPSIPDSSEVPYLRIFGLDRTDGTGTGRPDNRIDLTSGLLNLTTGLLTFPVLEPFTPPADSVAKWTRDANGVPQFSFADPFYQPQYDKSVRIYHERLNSTTEQEVHQYIIKVTAVSTSKTFRINALNIVEGSETITINNDKLARGTDYDIDYLTGEVSLKEGAFAKLTPDARINVEYQFKPLGGAGSSTLAGFATTSQLGQNLRLGTTALYESKSTSDQRPRLGEEPTRAIVGGVTSSYQHQSQLLTDLANLLPYVDSDAPSTINIDGELAVSLPNPNTKHEAYIDDFEGIEDTDRIALARRAWYPASLPFDQGKFKKAADRLDFIWYNIEPDLGVHRRDLNPELDEQENTLVQSLDIDLSEMPTAADDSSYAGIMLGIPGGGLDLSQGQFIELWVNDFKDVAITRGGKLHIDMGIIDENFYEPENTDPTTNFNDEDKLRDGFAAAFDDTGLDGIFDKDGEPAKPGGTSDDPGGDDILLTRVDGRFSKANGTEANLNYDTEDLDRNGQLTRENAYFSYVINLADPAQIDIRERFPGYTGFDKPGHGNDAWRLYRVKLSNNTVVATSGIQPRLDEIRHIRIWFDDVNTVVRDDNATGKRRLQIAELSIEGNRWEIDGVRGVVAEQLVTPTNTQFAIGVISTKTDPGYYHPPVTPNKKNEVSDKESSLALRYTDLAETTSVQVLKRFPGQGLNLTLYRDLNFWAHTDSLRAGVEYYFRLGSNEDNYYEVTVPFTSAFYNGTGWARVMVDIAELTGLKFEPSAPVVFGEATDIADPSRKYPIRMRGQPSLTGVRFLYAGVRNVSGGTRSGELWMDDIFTGDVMKDMDHAERLNASLSFAGGALSVGGGWTRTGADYRGLRQSRGSGADQTTLGFNARTDLQYFIPLGGFSIPIAGNYGVSKSTPKFPPNSDTEILEQDIADSLRTERKTRSFSTSVSKRSPSNNVLMRYSLDRIRPTFAYSDQRGISPSIRDTTTNMQGSVGYQLSWSGDHTFKILGKNRMRWWINQIDFSVSANRTTAKRWSFVGGSFREDPYQYSAAMRQQGSVRYEPFRSLDASFNGFVQRDVGLEHLWANINIGEEVARGENLRVSFIVPKWIGVRLFEPSVEVQTNYNEDSGPNVRRPGDPEGTRNVSASRNDTGKMRFDLGKHVGAVFKVFGWDPGVMATGPPRTEPPPPSPGGPAGQGGTGQGAGAVPDSTATPAKSRPGIGHLGRRIGQILVSVRPVQLNVQHRENSSYQRIADRPDVSYQLGITTDTGLEIDGKKVDQPDNRSENLSFNLDSSVQLSPRFDVQGRYARAITDSDFRANRSRQVSINWPDLQANWDGLGDFKPLRPVISAGQLTLSYRETHQESGQRDEEPATINESLTLTPAVVLTWKNELNTTFNVAYTNNTSDTRGSKSTSTNLSVNLDLKRNFRGGGGLNFFGKKMKWNNELETNLTMAYARTGGERSTPGSSLVEPIPATTSLRVAPTVRYFFSRNINGSAFIDFSRSFAEQTDQTTTAVRVGVSAVINF